MTPDPGRAGAQPPEVALSDEESAVIASILLESGAEPTLISDADRQTILEANRRACEVFGYGREEFIGMPVYRLMAPELSSRTAAEAVTHTLDTTGVYRNNRMPAARKDGTRFIADLSVRRLRIGTRRYSVSIFRDLTESMRADEFYRALFLEARQVIGLVDPETFTFVDLNEAAARMLGYAREELIGRSVFDMHPPHNLERARSAARESLGAEGGLLTGLWLRRKDGTEIPAEISAKTVVIGGRRYLVAVLTDLSDRHAAERSLREAADVAQRQTSELAEAKGFLEALREHTNDGISVVDDTGIIVYCNAAGATNVGLKPEQVMGRHYSEFLRPGERERHDENLRRIGAGERQTTRVEIPRADGTTRIMEAHSVSVAWGGRTYVLSNTQDVTERAQAERSLTEAKGRLEAIQEAASDAIYLMNSKGTIVSLNSRAATMMGRARKDVVGCYYNDFSPATLKAERERQFRRVLEGETVRVRSTMHRPDGMTVEFESTSYRVEWGGEHYCCATVRDVSDETRAQRRLAAQHAVTRVLAEARTLPEATPLVVKAICESLGWEAGAVWSVDRAADVLRCAEFWHVPTVRMPAFEKISREREFVRGVGLPGRVWASCEPAWIPDVTLDANFPRSPYAAKAGLHGAFGFPITLGAEVVGMLEFFSREIRQPDDDLLKMMSSIGSQIGQFIERRRAEEDLRRAMDEARRAYARLKRTQDQLVRSERLASAGMLLSGVAHEINNPIHVIAGNLKLLRQKCRALKSMLARGSKPSAVRALIEPVPAMVGDALRAAEDAEKVILEFRQFARDPRTAEETELAPVIAQALAALKTPLAGVRVVKKIGALPPVRCIPGQIQHAIMNLVKNAGEAMNGKGTLRLEAVKARGGIVITIVDTGPGISKEHLAEIFEPFFTTKAEGHGMGLGLPITATIVQNHGGTIKVTSRPGHGTRAVIFLPAAR